MTCEEARLALLDAEPDELTGVYDSALAVHVRSCDACGAQAAAIVAGTATLRAALAAAVTAAEQTRATRPGEVAPSAGARQPWRAWRRIGLPPQRARRLAARALVPLAAAAVLALMLLDDAAIRLPGGVVLRAPFAAASRIDLFVPEPHVPDAPVVNAQGASGVAVMRTTDPTITVVWTF